MGIEEYIRQNAGSFDTEEPREGHELRFLAKAEAFGRKRRFREAMLAAAGMAAVFAAVLILVPRSRTGKWSASAGDDPNAIYTAYLNEYQRFCESMTDTESEAVLDAITREAVPLLEQLPDELSDKEKSEILRGYYGTLLEGIETAKNKLQ